MFKFANCKRFPGRVNSIQWIIIYYNPIKTHGKSQLNLIKSQLTSLNPIKPH